MTVDLGTYFGRLIMQRTILRCIYLLTFESYAFIRLAAPIRQIRPAPNNQTATGWDTAAEKVAKPFAE